MPIRARMTIWYVGLLALVIAAVGAFVVVSLRADLTDSVDRSLRPAVRQIAAGYHAEGAPEFRDTAASVLAGERAAAQILTLNRRVVLAYGDPVAARPLLGSAAVRTSAGPLTVDADGGRFRVAARPTRRRGQRVIAVAAVSMAPVDRSVHRVLVLLLFACPAALIATALGGWWLARRSLRPVDTMTRTATAIGVERLGDRVPEPRTRDEVGQLAATLNSMLARIEHGVAEQRRLVADASHELRTPLAAMRAELDVSLRLDDLDPQGRALLESVREEVDRLSRTVDDLLTLAAADAGRMALRAEPIELRELARTVVAELEPLAGGKHVRLAVSGDGGLVTADLAALHHALRNVVENAIEFSAPNGRVEVVTTSANGTASVAVRDEGPGIPPEHRERVFERFYRVDPSRTRSSGGSGLGLAITAELVRAQGGTVWVEESQPRGSRFNIELPAG
jgi:heavy metal sensor kinase